MNRIICVIAFFFLALSSCTQKKNYSNMKNINQDRIMVSLLAGQSTSDAGIEEMINEVVAQKLTNLELDWECVDWGTQFHEQMRAKIAAGDIPDIMIGKAQDVATYASSGVIAPYSLEFSSLVEESALASVSKGGLVYGLPFNTFYQGVFYDKSLFDSYGVQPPQNEQELFNLVAFFKSKGIVPFATHFADTWYIGNILMQFALGEVFLSMPYWGDTFREGKVSFLTSKEFRHCFNTLSFVYANTWTDPSSVSNIECDERFANGEAAMYITGSWMLQSVEASRSGIEVGVFPYPNKKGDAHLIYEPNMTFMKSSNSIHNQSIDSILSLIFTDLDLSYQIFDYTKTSSLLRNLGLEVLESLENEVQQYRDKNKMIDATVGNSQIMWSFQQDLAGKTHEWLRGSVSLDSVLQYADDIRFLSAP